MYLTPINTKYHNVTVHTHVMYFIHMIVISYMMYSTRQPNTITPYMCKQFGISFPQGSILSTFC